MVQKNKNNFFGIPLYTWTNFATGIDLGQAIRPAECLQYEALMAMVLRMLLTETAITCRRQVQHRWEHWALQIANSKEN